MAKLTLSNILAGFRGTNGLNQNFDSIEAALEKTLSRDGTAPNAMLAPLDMNGQQILNLPAPTTANSAVRKVDLDNAVIAGGGGGGGGAVDSVNGKTGVVVLVPSDIGAAVAGSGVTSVNGSTGAVSVTTTTIGAIPTTQKAVANGVATLDSSGLIPSSQLPTSGSYKGTWDASTNTPTIVSNTGTNGDFYKVATAGTTNINGVATWAVGDEIRFNGTIWQKIANSAAVSSVNGQTGAVTITATGLGAVTSVNGNSGVVTVTAAGLGAVTSVGVTAPVASTGGLTPTISMPAANTTTNGHLLSSDWNTFNAKQAALVSGTNIKTINGTPILGSGDLTISGSSGGAAIDLSNVSDADFGGKTFTATGSSRARASNARAADVADANDFHATGTWGVNATADTSALTSAIAAMGSGRNTLLLPDKTFLINPANILTIPNNSRVLARSHKTVAKLGSALAFNQMLSFNNVDTLTIEGLTLEGNTETFKRVPFTCTYTEGSGTLSNIASTVGIIAGMKLIGWQGYRGTVVSVGANSIVVTPVADSTTVPGVAAGWVTVNSKPSTATTCTSDALLGFYRSSNVLLQDVYVNDQQAFGVSFDCGTHNRWIGGGSKLLIPESTLNSGFVVSSNVRAYQQATASQTIFDFGGLIGSGTGKVYVNNVLQTSGYTATINGSSTRITFATGRTAGDLVEFIIVASGSTEAHASDFTARDLILEGTAFQLDCDGAVLDNLLVRNAKYGGCGSLALSQICRNILIIGGTYSGAATRDADDTMAPGIESFAADASFVGVTFSDNGGYGLTVGGKNNKVIGCTFKNNGKTQTGSAGLQMRYSNMTYNPSGTVIEGNRAYDSSIPKLQGYGLGFANDITGTIPPTGVTLGLGNDWSGNLTADVLYTSASNTIPIGGGGSGGAGSFTSLAYSTTLTGGTDVVNIGSGQIYKDVSGNVGIGTATPTDKLHIIDQANAGFRFAGYNNTSGPLFRFQAARGTLAAPTALTTDTVLFSFRGAGYTSAGSFGAAGAARIDAKAAEAFTSTNQGTYITFSTTPIGSIVASQNMIIAANGNVGIGTGAPGEKLSLGGAADLYMSLSTTGNVKTQLTASDTLGSGAISTVSNHPLLFNTFNTERLRIEAGGNIGIGVVPQASALLDVQSTTKGVRFPNMTTAQKNAIASPVLGLVVFDTNLNKLCLYTGTWQTITSA